MEHFTQELYDFYQNLQDDMSREVFKEKLLYFLDRDEEHNRTLFKRDLKLDDIKKELDEIREFQKEGRKIIFYGAGGRAIDMKMFLDHLHIEACAFCDRNKSKQGTAMWGLPIISLEELAQNYKDAVVIITTSMFYSEGIKRDLNELGIKLVYDFLSFSELPYVDHPFLRPMQDNEIYVDCGVFDGRTMENFAAFSNNNYKKIYGFEPDDINCARTTDYLEKQHIERVELIKKGAWSENAMLSFANEGISTSRISDSGNVTIPVTTIDEVVGDDIVTFIKMDIEGAELEALKGARRTISKNRPQLAICVYHKPEDILELPLYIKSLVPDYKFYLRPHILNSATYVLYAV